jgi:hypothetical protein
MSTTPGRSASAGGAPADMPARLWEAAKHGARGTIPQWVRAAPDAGATAPPRIGQVARRATQAAAAAGVVAAGIGIGIGATEVASHPVDLAHPGDGAPGPDHASTGPGDGAPGAAHISTDLGTGSTASSDSSGVTLHTSVDGGHLDTGLATTWRIPGHGAVSGGHGEAGVEEGHEELTVDMYQDVVVHEGTDGMFSVDAVEYVVVRDEHGHTYVFRDNYHTVVPDPPGQETDLIIHETDRAQVVEHRDGSFSVTQADNSIGVTVGADGDGKDEVTVTQTESVQIGHDPHTDGHDTASLTETEYGATTSDQTEVVTDQTLPSKAGPDQPWVSVPQPPIAGSMTSSTASMAASSQVGAGQSVPGGAFFGAGGMSVPPPVAPGLGATGAAGGLGSGYEPHPVGAFAGPGGGPGEPGAGAGPAGHFANEPVPAQGLAGGAFGSASSPAASKSFGHPAAEPPVGASGPDPGHGAAFAGHDEPGLGDPGGHVGLDMAGVDPADGDAVGAGGHEEAGGVHPGSAAGGDPVASGHDPGADTPVVH